MFKENTVLVLGAGASCHYGYPTGEGLIDRIIDTIRNTPFEYSFAYLKDKSKQKLYETIPDYKKLCDYLEFYDPLSIDFFLSQFSNDKSILDAGKTIIAYEILNAEDPRLLERFEPVDVTRKRYSAGLVNSPEKIRNENWYRFLIHALTADANPKALLEDELKLHIITFNYDISLEYSLYSRFINSPLLGDNAGSFLKKVSDNIIHIYGQIGKFQWQGGGARSNSSYGYAKGISALTQADFFKDSIFVIGQDRDKQVENNANIAKQWLKNAERIYFLGFGFNEENIRLLELSNLPKPMHIYCTNFNDSKIIEQKINDLFLRINPSPQQRRKPIVSTKTVFGALAGDFSLLT